jgi:hypothetical protein
MQEGDLGLVAARLVHDVAQWPPLGQRADILAEQDMPLSTGKSLLSIWRAGPNASINMSITQHETRLVSLEVRFGSRLRENADFRPSVVLELTLARSEARGNDGRDVFRVPRLCGSVEPSNKGDLARVSYGGSCQARMAAIAGPLYLRKSAMVLKSGDSRPVSQISSMLRCVSRSSRRLDGMRFR